MARDPNSNQIVFSPKVDKPVAVRKGSKTDIMLQLMQRKNGATLQEIATALTEAGGAKCSLSYARSWCSPSYLAHKGYGIRSKHDANGALRLFAYATSTVVNTSRRDVDTDAKARRGGRRQQRSKSVAA